MICISSEGTRLWNSNSEHYKATVWKVYDSGKVIQYDEGSGGVTTETKKCELSESGKKYAIANLEQ